MIINHNYHLFCNIYRILARDKTTIANRLMLGVRAIHLGEKDVEHVGPVPIAYRFNPAAYTLQLQYDNSSQIQRRSSVGFEVIVFITLSM